MYLKKLNEYLVNEISGNILQGQVNGTPGTGFELDLSGRLFTYVLTVLVNESKKKKKKIVLKV